MQEVQDYVIVTAVITGNVNGVGAVPKIFISYQKEHNELLVGRIKDRLTEAFGYQQVFDEVPMTKANRDASLAAALDVTDFVVAIIGPEWKTEVMNNEDHPMYQELLVALRKENLKILPVLVNGATMPEPTEYPLPLRRLHYRNPYPMRPGTQFVHDVERLMRRLQGIDQTQTMSAIPESRGCIYRSPLYLIVGTAVFLMIILLVVSSWFQINPLNWVLNQVAQTQPTDLPEVIPPLAEINADLAIPLRLTADGGFVRSAPNANAGLLYRATSGETLNAHAQIRTDHEEFPTWLLVEVPDEPGFFGWIWIGVFEPESQDIGFGLEMYEEIENAETRFPIGSR